MRMMRSILAAVTLGWGGEALTTVGNDHATRALGAPLVFMAPNVGGLDSLDFFREPDAWTSVRPRPDLFRFCEVHLRDAGAAGCVAANDVTLDKLLAVDAFGKLESWGIAIGVEIPSVEDWDRTGTVAALRAGTSC